LIRWLEKKFPQKHLLTERVVPVPELFVRLAKAPGVPQLLADG